LNGELDAAVSWSGSIMTTSIALTMGQALPGENSVNFNGILDDVNLYDYVLQPAAIQQLYGGTTAVRQGKDENIPLTVTLDQNFPNPFNGSTSIQFSLPPGERPQMVTVEIYDILGRSIAVPFSGPLGSGPHIVHWDAGSVPTGIYFFQLNTPQSVLSRPLLILR